MLTNIELCNHQLHYSSKNTNLDESINDIDRFIINMFNNQQNIDPEIQNVINKEFWNLI